MMTGVIVEANTAMFVGLSVRDERTYYDTLICYYRSGGTL